MNSIAYIAQQSDVATKFAAQLRQAGYEVLDHIGDHAVDLVLIDLRQLAVPNLVDTAALAESNAPIVVLADTPPAPLLGAIEIAGWLTTPVQAGEVVGAVRAILAARALVAHRPPAVLVQHERDEYALADQKKDEFISYMSHELKNPMASIKGYADLLRRRLNKTPDDPNRKGLEIISAQVARMTLLLDQLLDFSRINMDRLQLNKRPTDLIDLTSRLIADMASVADRHALLLDADAAQLTATVDANRIQQALQYLIANAIKFSPQPGTIIISVHQHEQGQAQVVVRDRGVGIPEGDQQRVFERFYRASNAPEQSGMGLGLFLARAIIQRHDGTIELESREGEGTALTVLLPLHEQPTLRATSLGEPLQI
ncbi:MAG: HAMP domain-containing histidine kinase [Roseiflexaceae bacterium]|nr:HAMP domain-containing histidine kinase [Roseiflexaceae bacterium]